MVSECLYLATKKAWSEDSSIGDTMMNRGDYTEQKWYDNISGTSGGDYDIEIYVDTNQYWPVELSNPSDCPGAKDQARNWIVENSNLFDNYDSIQVHDTRDFDDYGGYASVKTAGTDWGISYVDASTPSTWNQKQASAHELCHTYGGDHYDGDGDKSETPTFEATELHGSLMLKYGTTSCEGSESHVEPQDWYSNCTKKHVKEYMDSAGIK